MCGLTRPDMVDDRHVTWPRSKGEDLDLYPAGPKTQHDSTSYSLHFPHFLPQHPASFFLQDIEEKKSVWLRTRWGENMTHEVDIPNC